MVIAIDYFRTNKGGNLDIVRKNQENRFKSTEHIDEIIKLDKKWTELSYLLTDASQNYENCKKIRDRKILTKEKLSGIFVLASDWKFYPITTAMMEKLSSEYLKDLSEYFSSEMESSRKELSLSEISRNNLLKDFGNILHPTVIISKNNSENGIERLIGDTTSRKPCSYTDLMQKICGTEFDMKTSHTDTNPIQKGPALLLTQAIIQYLFKKLSEKDYSCSYTSYFSNKAKKNETNQLNKIDPEIKELAENKVRGYNLCGAEYLTAPSELSIAEFYRNEEIKSENLPIKYAYLSSSFSQNSINGDKSTLEMPRLQEFDKVDQFLICSPMDNKSWEMFDIIIDNLEVFVKDLGLGYRIINVVSGELDNASSKKYELQAWFPSSGNFQDLFSFSNCTDYISREFNIKYDLSKAKSPQDEYVHTLSCTMRDVAKILFCILETHQTEKGINLPEVLHPYIPSSMKFMKFMDLSEEKVKTKKLSASSSVEVFDMDL